MNAKESGWCRWYLDSDCEGIGAPTAEYGRRLELCKSCATKWAKEVAS